jgi:hypothetical protein
MVKRPITTVPRRCAKAEFGVESRVGLHAAKYAPADGSTYAVFHGGLWTFRGNTGTLP